MKYRLLLQSDNAALNIASIALTMVVGFPTSILSVKSKYSRQVVQARIVTPCASSRLMWSSTFEPVHTRRTPVFQKTRLSGFFLAFSSNRKKLAINSPPNLSSPLPSPSAWIRKLSFQIRPPINVFLVSIFDSVNVSAKYLSQNSGADGANRLRFGRNSQSNAQIIHKQPVEARVQGAPPAKTTLSLMPTRRTIVAMRVVMA